MGISRKLKMLNANLKNKAFNTLQQLKNEIREKSSEESILNNSKTSREMDVEIIDSNTNNSQLEKRNM